MNRSSWIIGCRLMRALGVIALAVLVAGCATTPPPSDEWPVATEPEVILEPGDVVKCQFLYWPELDDEQAIRPDGKLSLRLVGEVRAQGLKPDELRTELVSLYEDKIKQPDINVVVTSFVSQRVYVGGEVRVPGILPLRGRLTALQAIMQAGGFNKGAAKMSSVVIIRQQDGKQCAQAINLKKTLQEPESDAFYLKPYDIVYVPRTAIDQVDQFVDQYINQIVPRNVYLIFNENLSDPSYNRNSLQYQLTPWLGGTTSF